MPTAAFSSAFIHLFRWWITAALVAGGAAQAAPALLTADELKAYALEQAQTTLNDPANRVEVQLGMPENVQTVAPCQRSEPFVPPGVKLWGRASVGVRCVLGASWRVIFPINVAVWGPAWVAVTPLPAGATVKATDLREAEIELTQERIGLPKTPEGLVGKVLVRPVQAGQAVPLDAVRATTVVSAGDLVRLRVLGGGFAITAAGQSLGSASEGQAVRVRTDFGRTVTGVARAGRIVDLQP